VWLCSVRCKPTTDSFRRFQMAEPCLAPVQRGNPRVSWDPNQTHSPYPRPQQHHPMPCAAVHRAGCTPTLSGTASCRNPVTPWLNHMRCAQGHSRIHQVHCRHMFCRTSLAFAALAHDPRRAKPYTPIPHTSRRTTAGCCASDESTATWHTGAICCSRQRQHPEAAARQGPHRKSRMARQTCLAPPSKCKKTVWLQAYALLQVSQALANQSQRHPVPNAATGCACMLGTGDTMCDAVIIPLF
jgi:hypothetical protein